MKKFEEAMLKVTRVENAVIVTSGCKEPDGGCTGIYSAETNENAPG